MFLAQVPVIPKILRCSLAPPNFPSIQCSPYLFVCSTFLFKVEKNRFGTASFFFLESAHAVLHQKNLVGVYGPLAKTLTLFVTKIGDIPYPIYGLSKSSKPYL